VHLVGGYSDFSITNYCWGSTARALWFIKSHLMPMVI